MIDCSTVWYSLSPSFEKQVNDISRWTLSSDFFTHYPQLIGFVPMHNAIPPSMGLEDIEPNAHEEGEADVASLEASGNIAGATTDLYDFSQAGMTFEMDTVGMAA